MKTLTLALLFSLATCSAFATPPATGVSFTFDDVSFGQTVICDTRDQLESISSAADPNTVFKTLRETRNAKDEPTCAAAFAFAAPVTEVAPLPNMTWAHTNHFHAWAVEFTTPAGYKLWALYLEPYKSIDA